MSNEYNSKHSAPATSNEAQIPLMQQQTVYQQMPPAGQAPGNVPAPGPGMGSPPSNVTQMYMNPHAVMAAAAQQVVQAQMHTSGANVHLQTQAVQPGPESAPSLDNATTTVHHVVNSSPNGAGTTSNTPPFTGTPSPSPASVASNGAQIAVAPPAPPFQSQVPQLPTHAQAQAAAILAASSLAPNLLFNQGAANGIPAFAAAQAFAYMLQQQAQAQPQTQPPQPQTQPLVQHPSQTLQNPSPPNLPLQSQPVPSPQQGSSTQLIKMQQPQSQRTNNLQPSHAPNDLQLQSSPSHLAPAHSNPQQLQKPTQVQQQKGPALKLAAQRNGSSTEREQPKHVPPSQSPLQHINHSVNSVAQSSISFNAPAQQIPFQVPAVAPLSAPSVLHHSLPSPPSAYSSACNPMILTQMQGWKLNQLESHVRLLRDTNQPVPQPVLILLSEARKLEEKRAAKRIANRKSACTSRARKKALVAEMTRTNARLRRQAIILSLLPDLVVAIKVSGEITFCSAQVERVLRHKTDDMVGANISEVLTPTSRTALANLVGKLVAAEKAALEDGNNKEGDESGRSSNSGNTSGAAIVSEQSDQGFPLSVVKVSCNRTGGANAGTDTSDSSGNVNVTETALSRSSHSNQSNSDGTANQNGTENTNRGVKATGNNGDDSSSSSDAKNLSKANEALNRNVRFHNMQIRNFKESRSKAAAHKDDVTGDSVTANNADARLSSLMLFPEVKKMTQQTSVSKKGESSNMENLQDDSSSSSGDSLLAGVEDMRHKKRKRAENSGSDDSGYRESGESDPSREDSASSTSDTSNGGRPRPLAPTCNICLIRDDLTTIWCEVTSSIRTRSLDEEQPDNSSIPGNVSPKEKKPKTSPNGIDEQQQNNPVVAQIKELLLCLRPIRDGEEKVTEELRFQPEKKALVQIGNDNSNISSNGLSLNYDATASNSSKSDMNNIRNQAENANMNRPPMKKRHLPLDVGDSSKTVKKESVGNQDVEAEKSVVESLILMSNHQK